MSYGVLSTFMCYQFRKYKERTPNFYSERWKSHIFFTQLLEIDIKNESSISTSVLSSSQYSGN